MDCVATPLQGFGSFGLNISAEPKITGVPVATPLQGFGSFGHQHELVSTDCSDVATPLQGFGSFGPSGN